jgi:microcystin-dependent protein
MVDPFLGQINAIGFNFAPRGWALCDGQLLPINQNQALFSLLGTTFGGDGRTTFALPDLRGRTAIHVGSGPGLSHYAWGQRGGHEETALLSANLPSHDHQLMVSNNVATTDSGKGNYLAKKTLGNDLIYETAAPTRALGSEAISNTGSSVPFDTRSPYLGIYHCIALQGIFPSRS